MAAYAGASTGTNEAPTPSDTASSAPPPDTPSKNLSPALARALERKKKNAAQTDSALSPPELQQPQQQQHAAAQAAAAATPSPKPADGGAAATSDAMDHAADEDEPLAAELEAQVRSCLLCTR